MLLAVDEERYLAGEYRKVRGKLVFIGVDGEAVLYFQCM